MLGCAKDLRNSCWGVFETENVVPILSTLCAVGMSLLAINSGRAAAELVECALTRGARPEARRPRRRPSPILSLATSQYTFQTPESALSARRMEAVLRSPGGSDLMNHLFLSSRYISRDVLLEKV